MPTMNYRKTIGALLLLLISAVPATAHADATAFWGFSPKPSTRSAAGFAIGVSLIVVGFEFEYSNTAEDLAGKAPGVRTGMFNGLIQTPTRTQLYFTAGGGVFRERLDEVSETQFATNVGGGVKLGLIGPLRLRVDYRVFNLRGHPIDKRPQRIYAGANLTF